MTLGSLCAALACFAGLQALFGIAPRVHPSGAALIRASTLSPLEWRLHQHNHEGWYRRWLRPIALLWGTRLHVRPARMDPLYLIQAGLDPEELDGVEFRVMRLMSALAGAVIACLLAVIASVGLALVPLLAWAGYIAPARVLAGRRRRRQDQVHRELPQLISMIRAFTVAGMPLERGLHLLSANTSPDSILKKEIRIALGRYGLGLSIEQALHEIGPRTGVDEVAMFVSALAQSKKAGSGLAATLRDQELMVRLSERNRATAQASSVSTKLLGVLGGIYLPEFVILIMIPLFWGIMQRAFG
ncbi:MAG: type II secretion system F family protein [Chloroflexi bacterium]|nr:MAG: type II secretion system F family protein [Chloroflexota bacterium]